MGHLKGYFDVGEFTWNEEYIWSMFFDVMRQNEFDVELFVNLNDVGPFFHFVLRHT